MDPQTRFAANRKISQGFNYIKPKYLCKHQTIPPLKGQGDVQ